MSDIVALIQEKITTGHVIEAGTLLKLHADAINDEKHDELQQAIAELQAAAEELVNQAEAAEKEGHVAKGLRLLHEAENTAADLPDLQAIATRMNDTVALTRALRNRSLRRTKPPAPGKPVRPGVKTLKTASLLTALLIISAWLIWKSPFSPLRQPEAVHQKNTATKLLPEILALSPAPPQIEATNAEQPFTKPPVEEKTKNITPVSRVEKGTLPASVTTEKTSPTTAAKGQENIPAQQTFFVSRPQVSLPTPQATGLPDKIPPSNQSPPKDSSRTYIIQPGDTLSSIANRLFCNEKERGTLYLMNKDRLASPSSIHSGVEIRLETDTINIANRCTR